MLSLHTAVASYLQPDCEQLFIPRLALAQQQSAAIDRCQLVEHKQLATFALATFVLATFATFILQQSYQHTHQHMHMLTM